MSFAIGESYRAPIARCKGKRMHELRATGVPAVVENLAAMNEASTASSRRVWDADRVRARIRQVFAEQGLSIRGVCEEAGISPGTLRHFLAGDTNTLMLETAVKLAHAAGVTIGTLIDEEGAPPPPPPEGALSARDAELLAEMLEKIQRDALESSERMDRLLGRLTRFRHRQGRRPTPPHR